MTNAMERVRNTTNKRLGAVAETLVLKASSNARHAYNNITGNNRRSFHYKAEGKNSLRAGSESGYGGFLELGTSLMAPHPHWAPAWAETKALVKTWKWEEE